jgi:undecaprenyl-diphosphatase
MNILTNTAAMICLTVLFIASALVGGPSNALEVRTMHWLAQVRADWPNATVAIGGITYLGGAYVTIGLASFASLWLLLRRLPGRTLLLALTVLLVRLLVEWLKDWIGRPRPHIGIDWLPTSLAFPSGHAANSMTAFLLMALVLAPQRWRAPWALGAMILSIIVGLSRIYLGVHWPSDVIGGWVFGLIAVGAAMAVGERSGVLRLEPQHEIVGGHRPALGEDEAA